MLDLNQTEIHFMLQAVQQASMLATFIQAEMVSGALDKEDRSPVTVADFACQALVASLLARTFPQDVLVAEEETTILRQADHKNILETVTHYVSEFLGATTTEKIGELIDRGSAYPTKRFWTLDPIDGTKGFLRGDQYAVALALIVNGEVQIGALGCPKLADGYLPDQKGPGSIMIAARHQGAWIKTINSGERFSKIQVSNCQDPSQARLLRSVEADHTNVEQVDNFVKQLGLVVEPIRMDSQAKYAVLATGHAELVVRFLTPLKPDYREKIWDQAAGSIIIEEAGGKISDTRGVLLDFSLGRTLIHNRGVLASNGYLHKVAVAAINNIG